MTKKDKAAGQAEAPVTSMAEVYALISEVRAAHERSAKKLMEGYDRPAHEQQLIEEFLPYVRQMLNDLAGAYVAPYVNNPAMQEVAVYWNADPKADFGDYPRGNITHILCAPHKNKLTGGNELFKEVVGVMMEKAGFKANMEMFISAAPVGTYTCNMVTGCAKDADEWSDIIYNFYLRANGDLQSALDFIKAADDATLKAAIAEGFKRHEHIVTQNHYAVARTEKAVAASAPAAPK